MIRSAVLLVAALLVVACSDSESGSLAIADVEIPDPTTPAPTAAESGDRRGRFHDDYVTYDGDCVDLGDAEALNGAIEAGIGRLEAFDGVNAVDLGEGRQLWIVQDAWVDDSADAVGIETLEEGQYMNNVAVVFDADGCTTLLHRPRTVNKRVSFEYGDGDVASKRYFWPMGMELHDGRVWVFWALMERSPNQPELMDGIVRHPTATYLASYDPTTLERLSFELAPASGVDPQWGVEVVSDEEWSYLYGNANLFNLAMAGGYDNGPHPSVDVFVARVPLGRFDVEPQAWDGEGWTDDLAEAVPISTRGYVANQMHPRRVGDRYVSVTTFDEFWDDELVIDVASSPQGPWIEADRFEIEIDTIVPIVTYHPVLLPADDGDPLIALVSTNAGIFEEAVANPALYRPYAYEIDRALLDLAPG